MGSKDRAQRVLDGEGVDDVLNAGKNQLYHVQRMGVVVKGADNVPMNDAYEIAKSGGKNAGLLRQLEKMSLSQVQKTGKSLSENIELHRGKIQNPSNHVPDWDGRSEKYRVGLVLHWSKEIRTFEDQMMIIEKVLNERTK